MATATLADKQNPLTSIEIRKNAGITARKTLTLRPLPSSEQFSAFLQQSVLIFMSFAGDYAHSSKPTTF